MLLSGPESDSDSDVGELPDVMEDIPETNYVHSPESEFGAVSYFFFLHLDVREYETGIEMRKIWEWNGTGQRI